MKVYLCARWGRREECLNLAEVLRHHRHSITSRWIYMAADESREHDRAAAALRDLEDIDDADVLVALTEPDPLVAGAGRGGRAVEVGYAIGTRTPVILLGRREANVFHHLAELPQLDDVLALLGLLRAMS